ncbi:MAG TPA: energy transducer TonB [Terriglobales bacterium]|nr:energy transducer TonB [Terriglobales bacterium]
MSNSFRRCGFFSMLITCVFGLFTLLYAEDSPRRLKSKVAPQYPELAKKMNVAGAVKLELIVGTNGQVKSVRPLGGHPLLIDAAENAVKQWRYEPGPEGTEVVEIRFNNNN